MLVMLPLCPTTKLRPALASFSLRFFPFFPHFPPNAVYAPRKLCNLHGGKQKEAQKKNGGTQKAMTLLQLCSVGASTKVFPGATQKLQTHRGGGGACEKKGGLGLGSGFWVPAGGHDGRRLRRRLGRVN